MGSGTSARSACALHCSPVTQRGLQLSWVVLLPRASLSSSVKWGYEPLPDDFLKGDQNNGYKVQCLSHRGALSTYVPGTEGGFSLPR